MATGTRRVALALACIVVGADNVPPSVRYPGGVLHPVTHAPVNCSSLTASNNSMHQALRPYDPANLLFQIPLAWSQCLASLNPDAILKQVLAVAETSPSCIRSMSALAMLKWPRANWTNTAYQSMCSPLVRSIVPCLKTGVLPAVFSPVLGSPCCVEMIHDFEDGVGDTPQVFLSNALEYAVNVVCSTQSPGFQGTANQTCGYALAKSFGTDSHSPIVSARVLTALQVPNNDTCNAALGNPFTTTSGVVNTTLFTTPDVPTSCVQPILDLVAYVRQWPVTANASLAGVHLADLFGDGTCVNGSLITTALGANLSAFLYRELLGVNVTQVNATCVHLANGKSCGWAGTFVAAVYTARGNGSTPAPSIRPSAASTAPHDHPIMSSIITALTLMATVALLA
ncbi:Aste57867_15330 [Aphanomyces stellatus]|uniref:Aste57867_15330 protein n=1 Tax=Aphanomyces stellatus TaxID=120398 RepID=A0A485L2X3_9STRA|nr:hypothetical protein As57867_015274 [Aphanomyces stellatus]VFT92139.1 Aste57867_15330 [Aphanomyces stellatus]